MGKPVPGTERTKFGPFDFAMIARNWAPPPKGYVDQFVNYRQLLEETYLVGDIERRFLLAGDNRIQELHLAPAYLLIAA